MSDLRNIITTLERGDTFTKIVLEQVRGRFMNHEDLPPDFKDKMKIYLDELSGTEYDSATMVSQAKVLQEAVKTHLHISESV